MSNGKVQTNDQGCNVLVETKNSQNRHYHHSDKRIIVEKVLTDEEIIEIWRTRSITDELAFAKRWVRCKEGYACSNIRDETLDINHESIVKYRKELSLPEKKGWYHIVLERGGFADVYFYPRTAHWCDKEDNQVGADGFAFSQKITAIAFIGE